MKRPVPLLYILILFFLSWPCLGQDRMLRGLVTDKDGNPLPGAGVVVKEVKGVGVSTDLDGKFEINVPAKGKTLVFSSLGMETVEYAIPQRLGGGIKISLGYEENFLDFFHIFHPLNRKRMSLNITTAISPSSRIMPAP